MREKPDLFGEIHKDEILKIAEEAAKKKGYAIYEDYEEYLGQRKLREGLKLATWAIPKIKIEIRRTLLKDKWIAMRGRGTRPTRFYPEHTDQLKLKEFENVEEV